jgi:hypothetical protein
MAGQTWEGSGPPTAGWGSGGSSKTATAHAGVSFKNVLRIAKAFGEGVSSYARVFAIAPRKNVERMWRLSSIEMLAPIVQ